MPLLLFYACNVIDKSEVIKGFVDTLSTDEKKTFTQKVKEILQNIKKWFVEYLERNQSKADEAQAVRDVPGRIDEQIKL